MKTTQHSHRRFELPEEHGLHSAWDIVGMLVAAAIMVFMIASGFMPVGQ